MADLSSLMQIAPYAGGFMTGQKNVADINQTNAETGRLQQLIEGLKIQNTQSSAMNPLLLTDQDLKNQKARAELPGISADSDLKRVNADKAKATLGSDIDKHLDDNKTAMAGNEVKKKAAQAQQLNAIAGEATAQGPMAQAYIQKKLQEIGVPQDNPLYRMNPAQLSDFSKKIITNTEAYWQHMDAEREKSASHEKVAGMQIQGQKDLEQMRINAGKYDSKKMSMDVSQAILRSRNAAQTAEIYDAAADAAQQANNENDFRRYQALAVAARQRAAEDANNRTQGQPGINTAQVAGGLPEKPRATATAPVGGAAADVGNPAPAGAPQKLPPGIGSVSDIKKLSPAYSKLSDAQIREIIKKKYGVDLK